MRDTLGTIREEIEDGIEDVSQTFVLNRWINRGVQAVARSYLWPSLNVRETVTVVSGVLIEPALLDGINVINKAGSGLPEDEFRYRARLQGKNMNRMGGYWYAPTDLKGTTDLSFSANVTANSNTIALGTATQSWPDSDDVGSRVTFAGNRGLYKITAVTTASATITPDYRGNSQIGVVAKVAPLGMKSWHLYDNNDALFSGSVDLDYQRCHPVLSDDEDELWFDAPDSVIAMVMVQAQRQMKYDASAERLKQEYQEALHREVGYLGRTPTDVLPQGLGGGPPLFTQRGQGDIFGRSY